MYDLTYCLERSLKEFFSSYNTKRKHVIKNSYKTYKTNYIILTHLYKKSLIFRSLKFN